jgi:hypothetical protein
LSSPRAFSESIGLVEPRSVIQRESMDGPLRNKLWDLVTLGFLAQDEIAIDVHPRGRVYRALWCDFFEYTFDSVPSYSSRVNAHVRSWFFDKAEWNGVYDLLTFLMRHVDPHSDLNSTELAEALNSRLEQYLSAYRWIGDSFVPIVDDVQIEAIEQALDSPLAGVREHISKALRLLADRDHPDEENSVKESVSAVESICSSIVGKKATLGAALSKLKDSGVKLHPALEEGWKKIYGYTSDADGIRHAMQDDPDLTVDDALYFVTSCSAFVGLLTSKAREAGLDLIAVT